MLKKGYFLDGFWIQEFYCYIVLKPQYDSYLMTLDKGENSRIRLEDCFLGRNFVESY